MTIDILTPEEVQILRELISQSQNIIICCHKSPDGDALGAMLGWAEFLRNQGKQSMMVAPDAFPDFLRWLPCIEKIVRYDKHKETGEEAFEKADLVFCLDFNCSKRLMDMQVTFDKFSGNKVLIDHHIGPDIDAKIVVSKPEMSSTCELLFRIIYQMGGFEAMTRQGAVPLYCGMMTDTGGFTYNSSRSDIFYIISLLLTKRFDKDKIYRNVYNNYSEWAIRMRGYVMSQKLNVLPESHASYFSITRKEMKRFHFIKGDAEGLVNEPLRIKGMRMVISLREDTEKDNTVWVSIRSVDHYYCNTIAEKFFNGGGHPNAAGGHLFCSMEEAEQVTLKAILYFANMYEMG
ncbi:MAG: DHH family phosphoesterase [Prevotella sp.]|nr:DHH family phosphoesterase [Prevotella sp.]